MNTELESVESAPEVKPELRCRACGEYLGNNNSPIEDGFASGKRPTDLQIICRVTGKDGRCGRTSRRMKYIVLIDFSVIWHICHWPAVKAVKADPKYILEDVIRTNLDGKMRTLQRDLRELQVEEYELIFVEDRMPRHKIELFPSYHHDRPDNSEKKTELKHYAQSNGFNCKFVHSEGNEADDAIASVAERALAHLDLFVVICTGDHDLWQLIGDRVGVFDLLQRRIVTKSHVIEKFGVDPNQIALVKSLWGDSSDNVPNVMPRQQKHLLPLVRKTDGSLDNLKQSISLGWDSLPANCQQLYAKNLEQIETNYALVSLNPNCELTWG